MIPSQPYDSLNFQNSPIRCSQFVLVSLVKNSNQFRESWGSRFGRFPFEHLVTILLIQHFMKTNPTPQVFFGFLDILTRLDFVKSEIGRGK